MDTYLIEAGEMLYFLDLAGVSLPATMTSEELGMPEGTRATAPSDEAATKRALVDALVAPQIVVRVWRMDAESGSGLVWYYWDGDAVVGVRKRESGDFELSTLPDFDALRTAVRSALTLRPVSEEEDFYAILSRADFIEARELANVWDEVPALDILEADGLDKPAAKELFDVATAPEWRTQVNLTGIREGGNIERVVRVAQGVETAWMATPVDPELTHIRVETVQDGELANLLWQYWDEVSG